MDTFSLKCLYSNFIIPHGTNLRSEKFLTPALLSSALSQTAVFLRGIETADVKLEQFDDWWEHDSLHFARPPQKQANNFDALLSLVATPQSLKASMTGDDYVFVGIAPQSYQWYLRFYCLTFWIQGDDEKWTLNQEDNGEKGRFDLTLPEEFVESYRQSVIEPLALKMQTQESIAYYRSIGMGSYIEVILNGE